jgi:mono/diheme cytochrome c family protein
MFRKDLLVAIGGVTMVWTATLAPASLAHQGGERSVNDGVYSASQAARGQKIYDASCASCHEPGRFTGPEFVKAWSGQPLQALFTTIRTTMPEDNPGSLTPEQYADVVALLLKFNDYPTGSMELAATEEAMKAVRMEPKAP